MWVVTQVPSPVIFSAPQLSQARFVFSRFQNIYLNSLYFSLHVSSLFSNCTSAHFCLLLQNCFTYMLILFHHIQIQSYSLQKSVEVLSEEKLYDVELRNFKLLPLLYMLNGCFYILSIRVRMGRARCTWQLSTGGSRGHRPSFRMVSFGACSIPLQKCRHFRGCSFQFWPRMPKDCSERCSTLRQILTWSCIDISHSTVS